MLICEEIGTPKRTDRVGEGGDGWHSLITENGNQQIIKIIWRFPSIQIRRYHRK